MIKMKGLKGHAAQNFLEQCRVDSKGPTRCKETDHKFSRVSYLIVCSCDVILQRLHCRWFSNIRMMTLQGEARVIVNNNGKTEAYTLDAANVMLAPLLKQSKGSTHGALKVQVSRASRSDETSYLLFAFSAVPGTS